MTRKPDLSADVIEDAAALLRGIAQEARLDRMRGVELWCDEGLATSLRELFRTVAVARRDGAARRSAAVKGAESGSTSTSRSKSTPASSRPKSTSTSRSTSTSTPTPISTPVSASGTGSRPSDRSGYQKVLDAIENPPPEPPAASTPQASKGLNEPGPSTPETKPVVERHSPPSVRPAVISQTSRGTASRPTSAANAKKPSWGPPPIASGRDSGWADQLAAVKAEAMQCRACTLCETRRNVVFGVGSGHVPVVFVGEAPGADEDRQGVPFVGQSGQLLTKIIEAIGLDRDEVYIVNILKCRPPANRNPSSEEIRHCTPFLTRQLEILRPKVICTLGLFASQFLLESTQSMGRMRGQRFTYERIPVIPTYHPAALLRNPDLKSKVWDDVQLLRKILDDAP